MDIISSLKRKIVFARIAVREPSILYHRHKSKNLKVSNSELSARQSDSINEIREIGLSQPPLSEKNTNLVLKMASRFDRLLAKGNFHQIPDPTRPNTVAFGSYLYYFNRGWADYFPEIALVIEDDLGDILRGYFGENYEIFGAEIARKKHIDENSPIKDPYSNFWHFDWRRKESSWLLVTLNLSNQKDGEAFQSLDLASSAKALKKGYHGRYHPKELPDEFKERKIFRAGGPSGTCTIANAADLLHRAGDPLPGTNRDVLFAFVGADVPWPNSNGFLNSNDTQQIDSDQSGIEN